MVERPTCDDCAWAGELVAISIRVSNRWGGFKALRARWLDHLGSASPRPVVLIDEAQEMTPMVLTCLEHLLATAGNAGLMTKELRHLLVTTPLATTAS